MSKLPDMSLRRNIPSTASVTIPGQDGRLLAAARTVMAPEDMPIGIVTRLIGGVFFVWLLGKWRA